MPCSSRAHDQQLGGRRDRAQQRRGREQADAEHEDPAPPVAVAERAAEQDQRRERQQVAVEDPLQGARRRVEVAADVGQRDVDDGAVEEREARPQDRATAGPSARRGCCRRLPWRRRWSRMAVPGYGGHRVDPTTIFARWVVCADGLHLARLRRPPRVPRSSPTGSPGQYVEPASRAHRGPDARRRHRRVGFRIDGMVGTSRGVDAGTSSRELPFETVPCDIHCVTKWSKLGTSFGGVSVDTLLEDVEPLGRVRDGVLVRRLHHQPPARATSPTARPGSSTEHEGEPLPREHGGPARLLVPHLYFWKSAKWVARPAGDGPRRARLLGAERLPQPRRSLEGGALLERLTPVEQRAPGAGRSPP